MGIRGNAANSAGASAISQHMHPFDRDFNGPESGHSDYDWAWDVSVIWRSEMERPVAPKLVERRDPLNNSPMPEFADELERQVIKDELAGAATRSEW